MWFLFYVKYLKVALWVFYFLVKDATIKSNTCSHNISINVAGVK